MTDHAATHYCSRCLTSFARDVERCPNLGCRRDRPSDGWGLILQDGDTFDRNYFIERKLAMGGAGVTYLGQQLDDKDQPSGPLLAIKVLLAHRDHGPYLKRLATEAGILRELDHPNIVQCMGFVHRSGYAPYLVTRFEEGGSLLDHIKRVGRLKTRVAAQIGRQVCWALSVAHARDIVHRDLKPENVLLASPVEADVDPVVRVADFGIAKVEGSLGSGLTRMGAFVGTPQYAAPEQFAGDKPSAATDVYAVGALIYFCIMARPIISFGERLSLEESFEQLLDSLPPKLDRPDDDAQDIARMNRVLRFAMDPDVTKRPTVEELDDQLGAIVAGHDPKLPEDPPAVHGDESGNEIAVPFVVTQTSRHDAEDPAETTTPVSPTGTLVAAPREEDESTTTPVSAAQRKKAAPPTVPSSVSSLTLDPQPTTTKDGGDSDGRAFGGLMAGAVLLGGLAAMGITGAAFVAWQYPSVLSDLGITAPADPPEDHPHDPEDPTEEVDISDAVDISGVHSEAMWSLRRQLEAGLDKQWSGATAYGEKSCGIDDPGALELTLVLEPDKSVRVARVEGLSDEANRCMALFYKHVKLSYKAQKNPILFHWAPPD